MSDRIKDPLGDYEGRWHKANQHKAGWKTGLSLLAALLLVGGVVAGVVYRGFF
jgi:hypothetical protein